MSASQATAPRHPFELLLEQLTGRMSIPASAGQQAQPLRHAFGSEEDAKAPARDRITWIPRGVGTEPIGYTIPGTVTTARLACEHEVVIHGASPTEVLQRAKDLEGWLDNLIGPPQGAPPPAGNGFKIGKSSGPLKGGDVASASWSLRLPVTLHDPVFSEIRPALVVGSVTVTTTAQAGADGTNAGAMAAQAG